MVVQTNLTSSTLEEKLKSAKVVLLLEIHNDPASNANIDLLNKSWKNNHLLFTEGRVARDAQGKSVRYPDIKKTIFNSSKSWDLPQSSKSEAMVVLEEKLVNRSIELLDYLYLSGNITSDLDASFQEIFNDLAPNSTDLKGTTISHLETKQQRELIEKLALSTLNQLKDIELQSMNRIYEEFFDRQVNMVNEIVLNLANHETLWLIAGEAHGRYISSHGIEGVAYLYQELEKNNIPYITLKYRSSVGEAPGEEERLGLLNNVSLISKYEADEALHAEECLSRWKESLNSYCDQMHSHSRSSVFLWTHAVLEDMQAFSLNLNSAQISDLNDFMQFALEEMLKAVD